MIERGKLGAESQLSEATGLLVGLDNEVRASEGRQQSIRQKRTSFIELYY